MNHIGRQSVSNPRQTKARAIAIAADADRAFAAMLIMQAGGLLALLLALLLIRP